MGAIRPIMSAIASECACPPLPNIWPMMPSALKNFAHIRMIELYAVVGLDEMRTPPLIAERFQFQHMGEIGKFEEVHVFIFCAASSSNEIVLYGAVIRSFMVASTSVIWQLPRRTGRPEDASLPL